jgi:hypothetical protein
VAGKIPPQFLKNVKKRQGASSSDTDSQFGAPSDNPFAKNSKTNKKSALTAEQKSKARKRALQNLQKKKD